MKFIAWLRIQEAELLCNFTMQLKYHYFLAILIFYQSN